MDTFYVKRDGGRLYAELSDRGNIVKVVFDEILVGDKEYIKFPIRCAEAYLSGEVIRVVPSYIKDVHLAWVHVCPIANPVAETASEDTQIVMAAVDEKFPRCGSAKMWVMANSSNGVPALITIEQQFETFLELD